MHEMFGFGRGQIGVHDTYLGGTLYSNMPPQVERTFDWLETKLLAMLFLF